MIGNRHSLPDHVRKSRDYKARLFDEHADEMRRIADETRRLEKQRRPPCDERDRRDDA